MKPSCRKLCLWNASSRVWKKLTREDKYYLVEKKKTFGEARHLTHQEGILLCEGVTAAWMVASVASITTMPTLSGGSLPKNCSISSDTLQISEVRDLFK